MTNAAPAIRIDDVELSSRFSGNREVALVCGLGGTVIFEMYEHSPKGEHYEGRTCDGKYARDWLDSAE